MPTLEEVAKINRELGEASPYFEQAAQFADQAAIEAVRAQAIHHRMANGVDLSDAEVQERYNYFRNEARRVRGLPAVSGAVLAEITRAQAEAETDRSALGNIGRGVRGGALNVLAAVMPGETGELASAAAAREAAGMAGPAKYLLGVPAQIATEIAPMLAGGALIRGAATATMPARAVPAITRAGVAGLAGGQSGRAAQFEALREGETPEQAARAALLSGAGTAALTGIFGLTGVEALLRPAARETAKQGFLRAVATAVGREAPKEALEEGFDELWQTFVGDAVLGRETTWGDYVQQALTGAAYGGVFGGAGGAGRAAMDRAAQLRTARPEAPEAPPAALTPDEGQSLRAVLEAAQAAPAPAPAVTPPPAPPAPKVQPAASAAPPDAPLPDAVATALRQAQVALASSQPLPNETVRPNVAAFIAEIQTAGPEQLAGVQQRLNILQQQTPLTQAEVDSIGSAMLAAANRVAVQATTQITGALQQQPAAPTQAPAVRAYLESLTAEDRVAAQQALDDPGMARQPDPDAALRTIQQYVEIARGRRARAARKAAAAPAVPAPAVRITSPVQIKQAIDRLPSMSLEEAERIQAAINQQMRATTTSRQFGRAAAEFAAKLADRKIAVTDAARVQAASEQARVRDPQIEAQAAAERQAVTQARQPDAQRPSGRGGTVIPAASRPADPAPTSAPVSPAPDIRAREPGDPTAGRPPVDPDRPAPRTEPAPERVLAQPDVTEQQARERRLNEQAEEARRDRLRVDPDGTLPQHATLDQDTEAALRASMASTRNVLAGFLRAEGERPAAAAAFASVLTELGIENVNVDPTSIAELRDTLARQRFGDDYAALSTDNRASIRQSISDAYLKAGNVAVESFPVRAENARVRIGPRLFAKATLYAPPSAAQALAAEYATLYPVYGRLYRAEVELFAASETAGMRSRQSKRQRERHDARQTAANAEAAAALAEARKDPEHAAKYSRFKRLNTVLRLHMEDEAIKSLRAVLAATPIANRPGRMKAYTSELQRLRDGVRADWERVVGDRMPIDPVTLRGSLAQRLLAKLDDGSFAVVGPAPNGSGWVAVDSQNRIASQYAPMTAKEQADFEAETQARAPGAGRAIDPRSIDAHRALFYARRRGITVPSATQALGIFDLFDIQGQTTGRADAEAEAESITLRSMDRRDISFKDPADFPAPQRRKDAGTGVEPTASDHTADAYLYRLLFRGDIAAPSGRAVPLAEVQAAGREKFGAAFDEALNQFRSAGFVEVYGDAPNQRIIGKQNDVAYHRIVSAIRPQPQDLVTAPAEVVESRERILKALGDAVDISISAGSRLRVRSTINGLYTAAQRVYLKDYGDLGVGAHEIGHALEGITAAQIDQAPSNIINELIAAAKDSGLTGHPSEGFAEVAAKVILGVDTSRYPDATAFVQAAIDRVGLTQPIAAVTKLAQARRAATPLARVGARIQTGEEQDRRRRERERTPTTSAEIALAKFLTHTTDDQAILGPVLRSLGIDPDKLPGHNDPEALARLSRSSNDLAVDQLLNGFDMGGTRKSPDSLASVLNFLTEKGLDPRVFETVLMSYAMLDSMPRARRAVAEQLNIDVEQLGQWTVDDQALVFENLSADEAADKAQAIYAEDLKTWRALRDQAKLAGKPAPPKPIKIDIGDRRFRGIEYAPEDIVDAARIVRDHATPEMREAVERMQAFYRAEAEWAHNNGQLTAADYTRATTQSYYAPMRTETTPGARLRRKGSASDVISPIESSIDRVMARTARTTIDRAVNAWTRVILDADAARGSDRSVKLVRLGDYVPIADARRMLTKTEAKREGVLAPKESEKEVFFRIDEETAQALVAAGKEKGDPANLVGRQAALRIEDTMVREALQPRAGGEPSNPFAAALAVTADLFRSLMTTLSPAFWYRNIIRDPMLAIAQSGGTKNPFTHLMTQFGSLFNPRSKEYRAAVASYVRSGASSSNVYGEHQTPLVALVEGDAQKILSAYLPTSLRARFARAPVFKQMIQASRYLERTTRIAEARRTMRTFLKERGLTSVDQLSPSEVKDLDVRVGRSAQEVTLNYQKRGRGVGRSLRYVPFLNATLQGNVKALEALLAPAKHLRNGDYGKATAALAANLGLIAGPAVLQLAAVAAAGADDEYEEIETRNRILFHHFPTPFRDAQGKRVWAKIPRIPGALAGMQVAVELAMLKDPVARDEITQTVFDTTMPMSIMPPLFELGMELALDYRIPGGVGLVGSEAPRPINPLPVGDDPTLQFTGRTSATAKALADLLGMTPAKTEWMIRSYGGGLGGLAMETSDLVRHALGADPTKASYRPSRYPMVRLMLMDDPGFGRRTITQAYDLVNDMEKGAADVKNLETQVKRGELSLEQARAKLVPETRFKAQAAKELREFRTEMAELRTLAQRIDNDQTMSVHDRRLALDGIYERATDASRNVLRAVRDAQARQSASR